MNQNHPAVGIVTQATNGNKPDSITHPVIVDAHTGEIMPDLPGVLTATSWRLPDGLSFDEWQVAGERIGRIVSGVQWWYGDYLAYGEIKYGETYAQAADITGYDPETLREMKWVSERVQSVVRTTDLSWTHHRVVAPLDEELQGYWLERASPLPGDTRPRLSVRELKAAISAEKFLASDAAQVRGKGTALVYYTDAIDFLTSLEPETADLLLTDPPYSTDVADIAGFVAEWVPLALSRLKPTGRAYICAGAYPDEMAAYLKTLLSQNRFQFGNVLVWTYRNTMGPGLTHDYKLNWQAIFYLRGPDAPELAAPSLNEQFSVIDITAPDGRHDTRVHAWQKPDELADRLIAHSTQSGDVVIDPFAGTGTFLAAGARAGCTALGSETDPDMVDLCRRRGCEVAP